MIRGYFGGYPGRRRPFLIVNLSLPAFNIEGTVHFLVDTGADSTILAPRNVLDLGLDVSRLPQDAPSTGIGGRAPMVSTEATLTLNTLSFPHPLTYSFPAGPRQLQALSTIPSLLGRDILSKFALFMEERTNKVILLQPHEADALNLR